jgi:sugar phosphate isomerase/epimerase
MRRRSFLQVLAALPASAAPNSVLRLSQLTASTASLSGMDFAGALRQIREMGFGGVEILTFTGAKHSAGPIPGAVVSQLGAEEKRRLRAAVGRFEHVSTHLPFHGLRPVARDPGIRKSTLDLLHTAIDDSGFWGATVATLHVAPEPGVTYDQLWPDLLSVFRELGDHAAKYHLRLGIETGAPDTVKQYLALIRDINHEFVGGTVDTGHTRGYTKDIGIAEDDRATPHGARRYNDVLMQKVEGLGLKLFHFHVDDVRPPDWREHRTLGTGLVEWTRLLAYVSRTGYRGMFAAELEETPPIEQLAKARAFFAQALAQLGG